MAHCVYLIISYQIYPVALGVPLRLALQWAFTKTKDMINLLTATESHLDQEMTLAWWVLLPHTVDYISRH